MKYFTRMQSTLCRIILAGDDAGLTHLHLCTGKSKRQFSIGADWVENPSFFSEAIEQLQHYFLGTRKKFDIKVNPEGTDFQKIIWKALVHIPYGAVATYKDIARTVGRQGASRAVGMANSKNPIPIIIPCHRVIGSDGRLTGFAHGLEVKERLLQLEKTNR